MSVLSRLARISRPYHATLIGGLVMVIIHTILDTVVLTMLFTALLTVVIGKSEVAKHGLRTTEVFGFDLTTLLSQWAGDGSHSAIRLLLALAGITLVVVLLKTSSLARQGYLMNQFANLVAREVRQRLFTHLLRLPPSYFEKESTGAHVSRITGDVTTLQTCMGPQLAEVLHGPLTVACSLAFMLRLNWALTLTALCLAPLIAFIIAAGGRKIRKLTIAIQERLAALNGALVERLGNVRIIQSFVREPFEAERVREFNDQYYRSTMRSVLVTEVLTPGIEFIGYIGMVLGVVLGGYFVLSGKMDGDAFFAFLLLAQKAGSQFKGLSRINQVRQQANGAGARIFALLDETPDIRDADDAVTLPPVEGVIAFEQVSFRYGSGADVLHEISLRAAPGEVIALVGPSGSGKTTLVNLLPRFYDPSAGRILVDGHDLRAVTLASLRAQVGIVPQETALFSGTIRDNIRYGRLEADDEEVRAAAAAANALEFIERLPDGFDTVVGERGMRLSGGQRQRVAIARALLKNPRILILDEATSALDTESEHLVQQALDRLMEGRTTFVIAHRLSTVKHATRILVLHQGRIIETGTHDALLTQGGLYQRLYDMQFRTGAISEA